MKVKTPDEIIEVPVYKAVDQRKKCKYCRDSSECYKYMNKKNSSTGAKIYCKKFAKKFYTIETILFVALELFGFWKIHSFCEASNKSIAIFALVALVYTIIILCLDTAISNLAKVISENRELRKRKKFDNKVEKIQKLNEQIEAENKKKEEIEKKEDFKEIIKTKTEKLESYLQTVNLIENSEYPAENREIKEELKMIFKKLKILNERINYENYNLILIKNFYEINLEMFLEKIQTYINFCNEKKITQEQMHELGKLLETMIVSIELYTNYIVKSDEEKFMIELKSLNNKFSAENNIY